MRNAIVDYYVRNATHKRPLFILTADLGFGLFQKDWQLFPHVTVLNVGVAEQNMIGIAAGIANCSSRVLCYSMASFLSLRAAEQIKIGVAFDNRNVILVGAASGLTCGLEGATHHALEDIAILGTYPNLTILSPSCNTELLDMINLLGDDHGPVYVRIGVDNALDLESCIPISKVGACWVYKHGSDVCILSHGSMLPCATEVAARLEDYGTSCTVASCPRLKPFDEEAVVEICSEHAMVVTIEEHSVHGGMTSLVATCLARHSHPRPMMAFCAQPEHYRNVGSREELLAMQGLSPTPICEAVRKAMCTSKGD